ncbi:ester cyclase [Sinorhizobium meliloti]|uniref:ester cyclase n=1 Tax=Rhizobium meliloti TaxID=382 RepID=UPI00048A0096|nr:ester cyclase [Sinorhizobium meliloti]MDW9645634.1 ester cyclase [Sinorhizobium meliloti]UFX12916.1 ester cyclase [Sinorhizobium meliloti]
MSADAAKAVVRRFYTELFRDLALAEECISPDYVDHNNADAGHGPNVLRPHVAALLHTFPDFTIEIEDILAEGDRVVTRVSGRGTHAGTWMRIEPTRSVIHVKGINIDRVSNGRIVEHWGEADTVGMLIQMGVDPFSGRAIGEPPTPR